MEHKIGETFQFGDVILKAVEGNASSCGKCYFQDGEYCNLRANDYKNIVGSCSMSEREDKTDVYFEQVNKDKMENLDLTKVLDGCPKGTNFWSPVFGDITFEEISYSMKNYPLIFSTYPNDSEEPRLSRYFTKNGFLFDCYPDAELVIFPSKNQRDWSKFERFWDKLKIERFDPKTLKPFDKVLVRDSNVDVWQCEMFSHFCSRETTYPFFCCGGPYYYCIPYNSETEHILGTSGEAPEFYRYWEEQS